MHIVITTVYCTSEEIQIVSGEHGKSGLIISNSHLEPLPAGVISSGWPRDELELKGILLSLRERQLLPKNGVELILSPETVETRRVAVPLLPPAKLRALARNEFAAEAAERELVCDYTVLNGRNDGGKGGSLLCGAVEAALIDCYSEVFRAAGIRLRRIDAAQAAVIGLGEFLFPGENFLLGILEEQSLYLLQFRDGSFTGDKRYPVFNLERRRNHTGWESTPAAVQKYSGDTAENDTATREDPLIKVAEELEAALSDFIDGSWKLYLCGVYSEESPLYEELSRRTGLSVQPLPSGLITTADERYSLSRQIYTTGAVLRKGAAR